MDFCFYYFFSTELVLKQEQEEYNREGIAWKNIEYFNNQIICDLVEQQHQGILALMDEACLNVGKVNDMVRDFETLSPNDFELEIIYFLFLL